MSTARSAAAGKRQQMRRELIRQYMRLQRDLLEENPSSSAYQATMHAFRQMGYAMITSGFEDDLDRLLRIRVLDGGRATRSEATDPAARPEMYVIESRPISQ